MAKEYVWEIKVCDRRRPPMSGFYVDLVEYTLDTEGNRDSDHYVTEEHFDDFASAKQHWDNNQYPNYVLYNEIEETELTRQDF
jgi:hypothetical protein